MFHIPLFISLVIFTLFVLGTALFFLFGVYHIVAAGEFSSLSFFMTALTGVAMVLVLFFTWYILAAHHIDWSAPFSFSPTPDSSSADSF